MPQKNTEIQVYINENDSIVNQLQKDVIQLTKLLKDVQNDSMIVSVERVKQKTINDLFFVIVQLI